MKTFKEFLLAQKESTAAKRAKNAGFLGLAVAGPEAGFNSGATANPGMLDYFNKNVKGKGLVKTKKQPQIDEAVIDKWLDFIDKLKKEIGSVPKDVPEDEPEINPSELDSLSGEEPEEDEDLDDADDENDEDEEEDEDEDEEEDEDDEEEDDDEEPEEDEDGNSPMLRKLILKPGAEFDDDGLEIPDESGHPDHPDNKHSNGLEDWARLSGLDS
jgi:hypothetical protein